MINNLMSVRTTCGRPRMGQRASRGIRHIRTAWFSPPPLPSIEEAVARMRGSPGFLASLTPDQWAALTEYDGPEIFGSPDGPRRAL